MKGEIPPFARRRRSGLLVLLSTVLLGGLAFSTEPPRVGVAVSGSEKAAQWQALLTGVLSQRGVVIVERADLGTILTEREAESAGGPGTIANVDVFLHFQQASPGHWIVGKVDAATGELLGSLPATAAGMDRADSLATAAATLLASALPSPPSGESRVAVLEGGAPDQAVLLFSAHLRDALRKAGLRVTDRALTQQVTLEKGDSERGWRERVVEQPFFGADFLLEVTSREGGYQIAVIRVRDGRLVGDKLISRTEAADVLTLERWLLPLLGGSAEEAESYLPSVELEALVPFYRGLALYNSGQYADATVEFYRAFLRNDKFSDALLWEARCYDALGMPQLAEGMRRYTRLGLVGNGSSGSARTIPTEAIAFLGVDGGPDALSAIAASALCRTERDVILPDSLERLRREYDWLAGLSSTIGPRWEQAPPFFCRLSLRGRAERQGGNLVVTWSLGDTALGRMLNTRSQTLSPDSSRWEAELSEFLPSLVSSVDGTCLVPPPVSCTDSVATLEEAMRRNKSLQTNAAFIKLALLDPANPRLPGKEFEKGQSKRDGLDAILNFAMRDYLLARLPADAPARPWLKLARILSFQEIEPVGRFATGQRPDVVAELRAFVAAHPQSPASLVARYSYLRELQDELPPAELARECDSLLEDLARAPDSFSDNRDTLYFMIVSMRDLALAAGGRGDVVLPHKEYKTVPRPVSIIWSADGRPRLKILGFWAPTAHTWFDLSSQERVREAAVILAINGRIGDRRTLHDDWIDRFPNSITLAAFAVSALHELNFWHGKPLQHPLDWKAEKTSFRRAVTYIDDTLSAWLPKAQNVETLDQMEQLIWAFFMALNERVYLGVISDGEYLALRDKLVARVQEANDRVGRKKWAWRQEKFLPWQTTTPSQARKLREDHLGEIGLEIYDLDVLRAQIAQTDIRARSSGTFDPVVLWERLRNWDLHDAFTAREISDHYLRFTPEILERYRQTPPTIKEFGYLLEQANVLLQGDRITEAEQIFRLILDGQPQDQLTPLRANAAFRLAQIMRYQGRKPEAIAMARLGLEICGATSWDFVGRRYKGDSEKDVREQGITGGLSANLTRFLTEVRFDPARAKLPPGVAVASVPTRNFENPELHVFYRVPPGPATDPRRALIFIPSYNHDVLDIFQPGSSWTRFADEQGLVLISPRFYSADRAQRASNPFAYFMHAQTWSGPALLDALAKINKITPLQMNRLLFHGYGAGAGFVSRFARWRPDLVAAISVHGGGYVLPWFQEYPGLKPLQDLRDVRCFITAGEDDDFAVSTQHRFACAEAFATVLAGAGVSVEWRPFPGVAHFPTPEMEAASQEFLARP